MPQFNILGLSLTFDHEYRAGHVCTEAEAALLQIVLVRGMAKGLHRVLAQARDAGNGDAEARALAEQFMETHLHGFQQGHERVRAIEVEARRIAAAAVEARLYARGVSSREVTQGEQEEMIKEMSERDSVRAEAERRVDDIRRLAQSAHNELLAARDEA